MKWPFVSRKKYETDMLEKECELFVQMGEVFEQAMKIDDLEEELNECWEFINHHHSNKHHSIKQKRDHGRFCKDDFDA
jgi:hypothetical protein